MMFSSPFAFEQTPDLFELFLSVGDNDDRIFRLQGDSGDGAKPLVQHAPSEVERRRWLRLPLALLWYISAYDVKGIQILWGWAQCGSTTSLRGQKSSRNCKTGFHCAECCDLSC